MKTCRETLEIAQPVRSKISKWPALHWTLSHSYGMSLAIWDHTVLPATQCKWTHHICLNPNQTGGCSIYLPRKDGRLSWPMVVGYIPRWFTCRQSLIL